MSVKPIKNLKTIMEGDILQHKSGNAYIVLRIRPDIIAVRTVMVTNTDEWLLFEFDEMWRNDDAE